MIARFLAGSGTALALILASPALAQAASPPEAKEPNKTEVDLLRSELANLRAQIDALQTRLDTQQIAVVKAEATSSEALGKAEAVSKASGGTAIAWKGAPEFRSEDGWTFKPRGRLQYDFGYVDAPDAIANDGIGFSNELRRVRLGAEGNIPGGFGYRFELEFAGGDALAHAFQLGHEKACHLIGLGRATRRIHTKQSRFRVRLTE